MNSRPPSSRRPRRRGGSGRGPRPGGRPSGPAAPSAPPPDLPWQLVDANAEPIPYTSLNLDRRLAAGLADLGFEGTRPVQGAVIPLALAGHDVVACAETGTGKTLAFAAPILQHLLREQPHYGDPAREPYTRALILAPTRELAVQIEDTLVGLTYHAPVTTAPVFGGVEMGPQERALKAGVDIVVATPGRLMDHMRHDAVDLLRVGVLVLDEADRMMDMGFWPDVQRILAALPPERQTLLFSATLPGEILRLATEMLRAPKFVQVGQRGAARTIRHEMQTVDGGDKIDWLASFIRRDATGPVLVFVRMKIGADRVARNLQARGIRAAALHADRSQQERLAAVEGFRSGKHPVLVATDIAARGLDIEGIAHVINYEVPDTPDTYVHRVGRTGRAGASGHAVTLVSPAEERAWRAVESAVGFEVG
ncbi:MAG: DEAD/DEAH box helicase [Acidobacteria bacterium]|nr:DEAD/DEAH box helicase [Acidobacteriota bacterium]